MTYPPPPPCPLLITRCLTGNAAQHLDPYAIARHLREWEIDERRRQVNRALDSEQTWEMMRRLISVPPWPTAVPTKEG